MFRGKGTAMELRAMMRKAVEREYPETEADKPENERRGRIPPSIEAMLDEAEQDAEVAKPSSRKEPSGGSSLEPPKKKAKQLINEKKCNSGRRRSQYRRMSGEHSPLCRLHGQELPGEH